MSRHIAYPRLRAQKLHTNIQHLTNNKQTLNKCISVNFKCNRWYGIIKILLYVGYFLPGYPYYRNRGHTNYTH